MMCVNEGEVEELMQSLKISLDTLHHAPANTRHSWPYLAA